MTKDTQEIKQISVKRNRTIHKRDHDDMQTTGQKQNPAVQVIEIVAAISMMLNVVQSVIIYILQAGPI